MDDIDIFDRINALSHEEEQLYADAGSGGGIDEPARTRLRQINIELDRAYDLLHQRQAKRNAGEDPSEAHARPADIVEGYEQ
jgi:Protein of unknown function (DUF2630)